MNEFDTVIGLEVHVQLGTASKIFCSCPTEFQAPANSNICPVCCGYPGVLPVFNQKALKLAVRVGLALNCQINPKIYFERKNYFYPDLPKGYQISQYKMPLAEGGFLPLPSGKKIGITRVHLEEDAGKSIHKEDYSLIDLNRTGTPLLEIVSEPEIGSPQEAFDYLTCLKQILQYIGTSTCDMEKGFLRCDANVSLKKKGDAQLGTKVELKNMNSFKGVREALAYELKRQTKQKASGEDILQETRLWEENKAKTFPMRSKEEAHDYRYFPDPDLLDFTVPEALCQAEQANIGELPLAKKARFIKQYKLPEKEVDILTASGYLADFFEGAAGEFSDYAKISGWLQGPFLERVNLLEGGFEAVKISPQNFAKVVQYFSQGKLNNLTAKKVLGLILTTDEDIDDVIQREGLGQVSGEDELTGFVRGAIAANPKAVAEYTGGKQQAIMFLVGQVMKKSKSKANPKVVKEMLERFLIKEA